MNSLIFASHVLVYPLSRDSPLTNPSINNMDSGPSQSTWNYRHSIEIPAVLISATDLDEFAPTFNPSLLKSQEISVNAKCEDHLAQKFIDQLDLVCYLAIVSPLQAKVFFRC